MANTSFTKYFLMAISAGLIVTYPMSSHAEAEIIPVTEGISDVKDVDKVNEKKAKAPSEFEVKIVSVGEKRIAVIKAVREITGLEYKEAKEIVDAEGMVVKTDLSEAEAEDIKARLESAGAVVKLEEIEDYGYEFNTLKKEDIITLNTKYKSITDVFSNYKLFWAEKRLAGKQLVAQYTPKNTDVKNWKHLLSIIHEEIPEEKIEDTSQYVKEYAGAITSIVNSTGTMINSTYRQGNVVNMSYLDYVIGEGEAREHILSLIWSHIPGYVTNIQYIKRGTPHSENDYKAFYTIMKKVMNEKTAQKNEEMKIANEELRKHVEAKNKITLEKNAQIKKENEIIQAKKDGTYVEPQQENTEPEEKQDQIQE